MVTVTEMHKKMIRTVINQLPLYIQQYSSADQRLLTEFLSILGYFEEAEYKRTYLINRLVEYNNTLLGTKIYLHTPFLWFSRAYLQKAQQILSRTDFHAQSFYEYLAKQLRTSKKQPGVFELIRKNTSLIDLAWEQLQYKSRLMLVPLSDNQYEMIQKMFRLVKNDAIRTLDPQLVRKHLIPDLSKGFTTKRDIFNFFTMLESIWQINYHSPAFGLSRLFYHIRMNDLPFEEIIPCHDSRNTVLNMSDIFTVRNASMDFIGVLYVPSHDINLLEEYLKIQEQKGVLKLKKLSVILTTRRSISLDLYKAGEGWSKIKSSYLNQIANEIKNTKTVSLFGDNNGNYLSSPFNPTWHFDQHQLPDEIIKLYCEISPQYTFSDLLLESETRNINSIHSLKNKGLLRQLFYNNVMNVDWIPWQMVYDYSLQYYWIILPKIDIKQIESLLRISPLSSANLSKENIFLWAYLTPETAQWIKEQFNWEVYTVTQYMSPWRAQYNWFDGNKLKWITPNFLQ